MSKFEPRKFIYNFDILSGKPSIFISGYRNYSTLTGLVLTIVILLVAIYYAVYSLFYFFCKKEITVVELQDNYMTKNVSLPLNNLLFAFNVFNVSMEMEYYWGKEINLNGANAVTKVAIDHNYTVVLSYINPENEKIIDKYYLEADYCELGKNIDQEIIDKYDFTDYSKYLCINRNHNFDILINKTHYVYIDVIVSINFDNENVFDHEDLYLDKNVYISAYNYLEFQVYTPNDLVSNKDKLEPIKFRKNYYNYELLTVGEMERYDMAAKYVDYSSDNGLIFKNEKQFYGIAIDSLTKKTLDLSSVKEAKHLLYFQFRYYLNPNSIESFERTYKKLPSVLADITSIISVLFTGGNFLISFLFKIYIETQTVFKVLRFDKDISSKIDLKKVMTRVCSMDISKSSTRQIDIEQSKKQLGGVSINQPGEVRLSNYFKKKRKLHKKQKKKISIFSNPYPSVDYSSKDKSNKKNSNDMKNMEPNEFINENENKNDNKNNENDRDNKRDDKSIIKPEQKMVIGLLSFRDYFMYMFCRDKNYKTKTIDKFSNLLEESLSIEEIFRRAIDLQKTNQFVKSKFEEEFNSFSIMKVISNIDNTFMEILQKDRKSNVEFEI